MASISVRSGAPGSPTHVSGSSSNGGGAGGGGSSGSGPVCRSRRNGLQDVDLNTFISEEMALHLDSTGSASAGGGGTRKRNSTQCSDVITDSPTHKRNRMIWSAACLCVCVGGSFKARRGGLMGLCGTDGQTDARMPGCAKEPELKMKTVTECLSSVCSGVEWILFLVSFPYTITTNHWSAIRTLDGCVCGWLGGLDDITHSLDVGVLERRQWRTSPEMQTVLKEVNMHCAAWQVKATWSWHICALPLMSLILTHHLNKEVRAMIKSSHSFNQVAHHMFDPALSEVTSSFCYFITAALSGGAKSPNRNTSFLIFRL